jgi:putative cell wall-binding protein
MFVLPMKRTLRTFISTALLIGTALLAAPVHADVTAQQDVTAPGLPTDIHVMPYSATTEDTFNVSMVMPEDDSGIDQIHYTLDVPPTSTLEGSSWSAADGFGGATENLLIFEVKGFHVAYIWLEDEEGNQDFTKTVRVPLFNEGVTDQLIRVGAEDRFATSAAVSKKLYPEDGTAASVILVNGDRAVDALGAVPLAIEADAPVLFTKAGAIPQVVWDEIRRVIPAGATVYVIGGETAIEPNQETFLTSHGYVAQRVGGSTRISTAVAIAGLAQSMRTDPWETFFLVNSQSLPDGLSVAPAAARFPGAVMFTERDRIPDEVFEYMKTSVRRTNMHAVYVIGGFDAISSDVIDQLATANLVGFRVGGRDRYATSAAVASTLFGESVQPIIGLANGDTVVDALTGGVHMAVHEAPVILVRQTVDASRCLATARLLSLESDVFEGGYVYGGAAAIADEMINFSQDLIGEQSLTGC